MFVTKLNTSHPLAVFTFMVTDVDECKTDPFACPANVECVNEVGSYHCRCPPGRFYSHRECKGQ